MNATLSIQILEADGSVTDNRDWVRLADNDDAYVSKMGRWMKSLERSGRKVLSIALA